MLTKEQLPINLREGKLAQIAKKCYEADLNEAAAIYVLLGCAEKCKDINATQFIDMLDKSKKMSYTFTSESLDCDFIKNGQITNSCPETAANYLSTSLCSMLSLNKNQFMLAVNYFNKLFARFSLVSKLEN